METEGHQSSGHSFGWRRAWILLTFPGSQAQCLTLKLETYEWFQVSKWDILLFYCQYVNSLKYYFLLFYFSSDFIYFPFLRWRLGHLGSLSHIAEVTDAKVVLELTLHEALPGGPESRHTDSVNWMSEAQLTRSGKWLIGGTWELFVRDVRLCRCLWISQKRTPRKNSYACPKDYRVL